MNRRDLIKALGLMGASMTIPSFAAKQSFAANISARELRNARAIINGEINFIAPASLPTVINIYMYGGPSELAGNLLNIEDITGAKGSKGMSQNDYKVARPDITQTFKRADNSGQITGNSLWKNAGGLIMEDLIAGNQMSIYRTINRVEGDTKAHRESIFTAQTGGLATMSTPGIGTTLAAILRVKMADKFENPDPTKQPIMPFVTFESQPVSYDLGDISLPPQLRAVSISSDLRNPYGYARAFNDNSSSPPDCIVDGKAQACSSALGQLADAVSGGYSPNYGRYVSAFSRRADLNVKFDATFNNLAGRMPAADANGAFGTLNNNNVQNTADTSFFLQDALNANTTAIKQGSLSFSSGFGATLRNAVLFALVNKDTRFITLSTGGLGGWDDHDNSIVKYEQRMQTLMSDLRNAVRLLRAGTATGGVADVNSARNDVVINVFGEFGRNVNLNGSMGWDHGNNMNLYTLGGHYTPGVSGVPGRTLGQVVGTTKVVGSGNDNRLYTTPDLAKDARTFQPYSIAATVYKYFGVQNPNVLTADPMLAPNGYGPIDG